MPRRVAPETLDRLAPEDPAAMRSRRDLVRVHRAMGTQSIVAQGWQGLVSPTSARRPLRILELGAGDGSLLLSVARSLAPRWPRVQLTLLDRQNIVDSTTLAGYAGMGWGTEVRHTDVLDWAAEGDRAGTPAPRWDLITTTLFLHHFESQQLGRLLSAVARRSDRFFACEPRRSWFPLAGSHLIGAIGANAVTREDAVLSVRAGFRGDEITAAWPGDSGDWQIREGAAGLFSHVFGAGRAGLA